MSNELKQVSAEYARQLKVNDKAMSYLTDYGVSEAVIDEAMLGLITEPVTDSHVQYKTMVVFPYISVHQVTMLRYGAIQLDDARQFNVGMVENNFHDASPLRVFNVTKMMPSISSDEVYLTEGVGPCLRLTSAGLRAASIPGWENWKPHWTELVRSSKVILVPAETSDPAALTAVGVSLHRANVNMTTSPLNCDDIIASL